MEPTNFIKSVVRKLSTHTHSSTHLYLNVLFLFLAFIIKAQVGIGTDTPDPSAILELNSENKVLLLPRINGVTKIKDPVEGSLIYDTKENCVSLYKNKRWICLMIKNHKPEATLTITGTLLVGEMLTAEVKGSDEDGDEVTFTYQWYRTEDKKGGVIELVEIKGATSKTYTLNDDDRNKYITVKVIPDDGKEKGNTVTSDYTARIPPFLVTIPDDHFRAYLKQKIPNAFPGGGEIMDFNHEEVRTLSTINVDNKNIGSLQGIEYFTALTFFFCYNNKLKSLDVSQNTALAVLGCGYNQLKSLDVSQNTALIQLDCVDNQLKSLDISQNTALIQLDCDDNQLTSLDLRNNCKLKSSRVIADSSVKITWCKNE